jgi:NTE family protein
MSDKLCGQKLGLVLEGGGVKGAYQLGALEALCEAGYSFSGVTGTSIGALNGALLVEGGLKKLKEFWADIRPSKIFDVDDETVERAFMLDFDKSVVGRVSHLLRNFKRTLTISSAKMQEYFSSFFDEKAIRESPVDFGLVTFSLSDMRPLELFKEQIPQGKLTDFLIASARYPLYGTFSIDGEKYIDGGVWDNMPINLLAKKGYKKIIVIRTKNTRPRRKPASDLDITYIIPRDDLGRAFHFTEERIRKNRLLGYFDALRELNGYRGFKYYFLPYPQEQAVSVINKIPQDAYTELAGELTGLKPRTKAGCTRVICTVIREELGLDYGTSDEAVLTLFELFGALCRVERFKVYDILDFMTETLKRAREKGSVLSEFMSNTKAVKSVRLRRIFFAFSKYLC